MKKLLMIFIFATTSFAYAGEAEELLKYSDRARGGIEGGVSWDVRLQSWENGRESDRKYFVKVRGVDALVEATAPSKHKGEIILFNDRTMWFFKPNLKKPVVISARQKLSGQASNGDIASTNYARDYTPQIVGTEKVGNENTKILLLKAKSDQVTYDQIRYWVSTRKRLAVKAEFMTLQGEPFKKATFEYNNSINHNGRKVPFISKIVLVDAKFPDNKSIMEYSNPKPATHPTAIFNVNNLSR